MRYEWRKMKAMTMRRGERINMRNVMIGNKIL